MNINKDILQWLQTHNNLITTSDVLSLGFSRAVLPMYVKKGILKRVSSGVYTLNGQETEPQDEIYLLSLRTSRYVYSNETALFLNGLTDKLSTPYSITAVSGTCLSQAVRSKCKCFYVKSEIYNLGITELQTPFGNIVKSYNAERTLCDIIKNRNRLDNRDIEIAAIKKYASMHGKNLWNLAEYAQALNIYPTVKVYIEMFL